MYLLENGNPWLTFVGVSVILKRTRNASQWWDERRRSPGQPSSRERWRRLQLLQHVKGLTLLSALTARVLGSSPADLYFSCSHDIVNIKPCYRKFSPSPRRETACNSQFVPFYSFSDGFLAVDRSVSNTKAIREQPLKIDLSKRERKVGLSSSARSRLDWRVVKTGRVSLQSLEDSQSRWSLDKIPSIHTFRS